MAYRHGNKTLFQYASVDRQKSNKFTKNMLRFRNQMIPAPSQGIVWCYNKHQPELSEKLISISLT